MKHSTRIVLFALVSVLALQGQAPTITIPDLSVRTVQSGLTGPTAIAFLGPNDFFVIEKNSGRVLRNQNGAVTTVLDLGVNFASERGLLGIALHPQFPQSPDVYLFWTCIGTAAGSPTPAELTCNNSTMFSPDSDEVLRVPLLGNRVDRFSWDGTALTFQQNLIMLRSYQNDGVSNPAGQADDTQPPRGNHDGGVIGFGPDGKLYVFFGDQGRRSQLQNLPFGPIKYDPPAPLAAVPDDQFGGPQADDAHFAGVVLRMNPDGSAPPDNPFFAAGTEMGGEVGDNLKLLFAYGLRNSFGMAFEPRTGLPWISQHGDDTFDEINRIIPGMNGGWTQVMGPLERIAEYKQIETTFFAAPEPFPSLQQWRWAPSQIANTAQEAMSRMFMLPGAHYVDPEFSWKWAALPVGLEFIKGKALGAELEGDLFVNLVGSPMGPGHLIRFRVTDGGNRLGFEQPELQDRVADNTAKFDLTESQDLVIGSGYGIATDLRMSPQGTLYVVSFSKGEIYEIFSTRPGDGEDDVNGGRPLRAQLTGSAEAPGPGDDDGTGSAELALNQGQGRICYQISVSNIEAANAAHIHSGESGVPGPVVVPLMAPSAISGTSSGCADVDKDLVKAIRQNPEKYYVNVHNASFPNGAIRGQLSK